VQRHVSPLDLQIIYVADEAATGAPDIFWFAKIAGPVARMQDLHGQAVSFYTPGSHTSPLD
jgi:hypothetical protein